VSPFLRPPHSALTLTGCAGLTRGPIRAWKALGGAPLDHRLTEAKLSERTRDLSRMWTGVQEYSAPLLCAESRFRAGTPDASAKGNRPHPRHWEALFIEIAASYNLKWTDIILYTDKFGPRNQSSAYCVPPGIGEQFVPKTKHLT